MNCVGLNDIPEAVFITGVSNGQSQAAGGVNAKGTVPS